MTSYKPDDCENCNATLLRLDDQNDSPLQNLAGRSVPTALTDATDYGDPGDMAAHWDVH